LFNYGIFRKTLGDSAASLVMATIGIIAFVVLFVWAMLNMGAQVLEFVSKFPFISKILEMGLGIRTSGEVSISIIFAVCFTHAVVLALTWTIMIATTTRVTVGEIERGTADLLLSLPVTRTTVYSSTTLVWLLAAVILSFCPIPGIWIGIHIFETGEPVDIFRYFPPALNFFCLNLAVGALSSMIACLLNRRGQAIGIVVGVAFVSSVINFLVPFLDTGTVSELIKNVRFLSLLNYFRPVDIVRTGHWPFAEMAALITFSLVCWAIGLFAFSRKDVPTA
jgi:ABC-2 type transport system permease protein